MSKKKRKTFSLDPSVHRYLTEEESNRNASGIVNDLLKHYRELGDSEVAATDKQIDELQNELQTLRQDRDEKERKIGRKESRLERLRDRREDLLDRQYDAVDDVVALLRAPEQPLTRDDLGPTHEIVVSRCESTDLSPQRFLEKVDQQLDGGDG